MAEQLPHWHVLGAGAIGCLFANALYQHGHSVSLILKQSNNSQELITVETPEQAAQSAQLAVGTASDAEAITHLLVTTKSYDVIEAVQSVATRLHKGSQLLLLINGMGLAEQLQALLPHVEIFCGSTTQGAYRLERHHIVHAGRGETRIGKTNSETPPAWFEHWAEAADNSHWDSRIEQTLWSKLAVNCVINPLTALNDCSNGELATRPELATQVTTLSDEIIQISYAAGFTQTAQSLHENVARVIHATAENQSSMLQDLRQGKRTEINDITGYLLKEAVRYAIPAPYNKQMLEKIEKHVR